MLFNSIDFAIFLPIIFILYWFVFNKNLKAQNLLIVVASYVFYGWWDWRFLFLIFFSSFVDFTVGVGLSKTNNERKRKLLLLTSVLVNIGFLGFFKYFNFFSESFANAFTLFGYGFEANRLNIILPVGISFYTFQTLSYSIDVYRRKLEPTKDVVAFFAFVSFFPQLVAGPIERAINLLPQFYTKRKFEYHKAVDGVQQILWGLFKKIVIADNCAVYVNDIFSNYTEYSGSTLFLGIILFSFQVYGDFSGYSDIAIGTARLFGFNLMQNFAFPYFSRDMAEIWRRWHISLTSWFVDYVYIPLGGSKGGKWMKIRNTFVIFVVSGFWHGANWTFIAWGFLYALLFLPLLLRNKNRIYTDTVAQGRYLPSVKEFFQMLSTFLLFSLPVVLFRSPTMKDAGIYFSKFFTTSMFNMPEVFPKKTFVLIGVLLITEWFMREKQHAMQFDTNQVSRVYRWGIYYFVICIIIFFGGSQQDFIYFQF